MRILMSADWHNPPDGLRDPALRFLELKGDVKYVLGDMLDFFAYDFREYIGSETVRELRMTEVKVISGNHDPLPLLSKLFEKSKCQVLGWEWEIDSYKLLHGHTYSDWWLWRWLTPIFLRVAPKIWVKLEIKPSQMKGDPEVYSRMVHLIWSNSLKASKGLFTPIFGHTHANAFLTTVDKLLMVNVGSLRDDHIYLLLQDGKIELREL